MLISQSSVIEPIEKLVIYRILNGRKIIKVLSVVISESLFGA